MYSTNESCFESSVTDWKKICHKDGQVKVHQIWTLFYHEYNDKLIYLSTSNMFVRIWKSALKKWRSIYPIILISNSFWRPFVQCTLWSTKGSSDLLLPQEVIKSTVLVFPYKVWLPCPNGNVIVLEVSSYWIRNQVTMFTWFTWRKWVSLIYGNFRQSINMDSCSNNNGISVDLWRGVPTDGLFEFEIRA